MQSRQEFVGFHEAPINFPPTFKYDVLRTIKRVKRHDSKLDRWKSFAGERGRLTEVEEKELEEAYDHDEESDDDPKMDGEAASVSSSVWTSMHSRPATDNDDDDDYFNRPASFKHSISAPGSKVSLSAAATRAKVKWMALISPSTSPSTPTNWLKPKQSFQSHSPANRRKRTNSVDVVRVVEMKSPQSTASLDTTSHSLLQPPPPIVARVGSSKSSVTSDDDNTGRLDEKGVYDSSHKRRVPSWQVQFSI